MTFPPERPADVVVVSGLPRSGTSLMMTMLEAGGVPVMTDRIRTADDDNPRGYFEFERVKQLPKGDHAWLPEARGKAVKVISALLQHLPPEYPYKVIFMRRALEEVLASQRTMLRRSNKPADAIADEQMTPLFQKHLGQIEAWLRSQPNLAALYVDYNRLVDDPKPEVERICDFLARPLDVERMIRAVDPALYRNRR